MAISFNARTAEVRHLLPKQEPAQREENASGEHYKSKGQPYWLPYFKLFNMYCGNNKITKWSTWITVDGQTFDKGDANDFSLFYTKEDGNIKKNMHKDVLMDLLKKGDFFLPLAIILCRSSRVYIAMTKIKTDGEKVTAVFWILKSKLTEFEEFFDLAWMWKAEDNLEKE